MAHLTNAQNLILKAAILAELDPVFVAARSGNDKPGMAAWFNADSSPAFIVWRRRVNTAEVGKTVNYVAVEAMTDANRTRITTFYAMNPVDFQPRDDIRTFWDNTFSGALGGQGQATRDALTALWKRTARRVEKLFATGTGTTLAPGELVFEGTLDANHIGEALEAV